MQNAHWFRWGTLNVWKFSRNISLRCAPYLKSYEFFPSTTNERIYWRVVGRTSHSVQEIFLRVWILGLIRTPNAKNRYHPLGSNILPYPYFDWTWIERIILSAKSIALKMIKPIWCWILRTRWSVSTLNSWWRWSFSDRALMLLPWPMRFSFINDLHLILSKVYT